MERVRLKQKSPEYIDESQAKKKHRACDVDGCDGTGDHKAPKDRHLKDYYHFCYAHVSDYNRAWNFFEGMSDSDVQDHIYSSLFENRPTWKFADYADVEDYIRQKAAGFQHGADSPQSEKRKDKYTQTPMAAKNTPEGEALAIIGLTPPVDLNEIKTKYKELAKQYHPDHNPDDPDAEEKLKDINMAYTVLRLAFQKYETMEKE